MAGHDETTEEFGWSDRTAMSVLRPFRSRQRTLLVLVPIFLGLLSVPLGFLWLAHVLSLAQGVTALGASLLLLPGVLFGLALNRGVTVSMGYVNAYANGDIVEVARLKRLMDGTGPPRSPFERANRALGDAEVLVYVERWVEGRDALAKVDREALPVRARPGVLGQRGYATAHAGQADLGVELLEAAVEEAAAQPDYPAEKQWFMRVRLGIALSLAGRHDDAVAVLAAVLAGVGDYDGDFREWTAAQFFLGRSLRACGTFDDAMVAFEAAARSGEGPFAPRARAALDLATGSPLRDDGHVREPIADEVVEPEEAEGRSLKRARRP